MKGSYRITTPGLTISNHKQHNMIDVTKLLPYFSVLLFFLFNDFTVPLEFLPWKTRVAFAGESQLR